MSQLLPRPPRLRLGHRHRDDAGGGLAIYNLPISQYPPIAPPSITIRASYPGASAKTVEDSVIQIIEQKMTGLDRMLYMHSTADSSGQRERRRSPSPRAPTPTSPGPRSRTSSSSPCPSLPDVVQTPGRHGQQVDPQLPAHRRPHHRGRQHDHGRPQRLRRLADRVRPRPRPGRRRGRDLRHRLLDAHLARPRQAHQVRDDLGRRRGGGAGLQRRGLRRPARRRAGRAGPAAQRLHPRPVAPGDPGGVRGHPPAHQPRRLGRPGQGRRPDRARHRAARHGGHLQRPARRPASPSGRRRAPTPSTPPTGSRPRWPSCRSTSRPA